MFQFRYTEKIGWGVTAPIPDEALSSRFAMSDWITFWRLSVMLQGKVLQNQATQECRPLQTQLIRPSMQRILTAHDNQSTRSQSALLPGVFRHRSRRSLATAFAGLVLVLPSPLQHSARVSQSSCSSQKKVPALLLRVGVDSIYNVLHFPERFAISVHIRFPLRCEFALQTVPSALTL